MLNMTSRNPTKTGGIEPSVKDDDHEPHKNWWDSNPVFKMTSMNPTKTGGIEPSVKDDGHEPH